MHFRQHALRMTLRWPWADLVCIAEGWRSFRHWMTIQSVSCVFRLSVPDDELRRYM